MVRLWKADPVTDVNDIHIFEDGELLVETSLSDIRARLAE